MSADAPTAAEIAAAFGVGPPTAPLTEVARGAMGRVWRLTTDSGDYAAKQLFDWARSDRVDLEARVVDAASAAGIATPAMIRGPDGRLVETVAGVRWRLFAWSDLGRAIVHPISHADAAEIGATLAALHRLNLAADPSEVIPWFTNRPPEANWRGVAAKVRETAPPWAAVLKAAMPDILGLTTTADPAGAIGPCVLSHCDLNGGNVFVDEDGVVLIDWEHASAIPPLWELGCLIQSWAMPPRGLDNPDAARAMVGAYRAAGGDSGPLDLGMFAGAITAHLNWSLGRVYTAVAAKEEAERERAVGQALELITHPLNRRRFEAMVAALNG